MCPVDGVVAVPAHPQARPPAAPAARPASPCPKGGFAVALKLYLVNPVPVRTLVRITDALVAEFPDATMGPGPVVDGAQTTTIYLEKQ